MKDEIIKNKKEVPFNAAVKDKGNKKIKKKDFDSYSSIDKRKIKKEKPLLTNFDSKKSFKDVMIFREKSTKEEKIERNILTEKSKNSNKTKKKTKFNTKRVISPINIKDDSSLEKQLNLNGNYYQQFFDEYLSTSDMEYDDAIIKDQRKFCEYFIECLKEKQMITYTFISFDPIKIRIIKIILFILNIVLYFLLLDYFLAKNI